MDGRDDTGQARYSENAACVSGSWVEVNFVSDSRQRESPSIANRTEPVSGSWKRGSDWPGMIRNVPAHRPWIPPSCEAGYRFVRNAFDAGQAECPIHAASATPRTAAISSAPRKYQTDFRHERFNVLPYRESTRPEEGYVQTR